LWKLVTVNAAKAMDMAGRVGVLQAGAHSDFVLFATKTSDPLGSVLDEELVPSDVWVAGRKM
jgi:imidazolonepropionase-like amidohydrolase